MKSIIRNLKTFYSHYKAFGSNGISFLVKRRMKKDSLIDISLPGHAQPIFLRNATSDIPMFYLVNFEKDYDLAFDFTPEVILDCGAHIGLSAIYFANKFPGVSVYCIEPEKTNYDLLVKNTLAYPNIVCLNYGIWNVSTKLKITDEGLGNWGFVTKEVEYSDEETIAAISIDEIMERFKLTHIDICKINIEGSEKELFEKNFDKWMSATKVIVIELHDRLKEGCANSFFKALLNYKFEIYGRSSYIIATLKNAGKSLMI